MFATLWYYFFQGGPARTTYRVVASNSYSAGGVMGYSYSAGGVTGKAYTAGATIGGSF